eukprot:2759463-Lingulodinium_polyedra.AAC.1
MRKRETLLKGPQDGGSGRPRAAGLQSARSGAGARDRTLVAQRRCRVALPLPSVDPIAPHDSM